MNRIIILSCLLFFSSTLTFAQELKARVTINSSRVGNNVNKSVFQTLQTSLFNLLNNRKWTAQAYASNEKIECNFMLNLESTEELNVYKGTMSIQSARPIFNSSYASPIINFKEDNLLFKYQEFQQLEFNDNRVTGSDPLASNLTAIVAYYAYLIIGVDATSFSSHGGDAYFQKAQNIVNNSPDGGGITGWKSFDGIRNRYWLIENFLNTRYSQIQDIYYDYYRKGFDMMYQDEKTARASVLNTLVKIDNFNIENPNTMVNAFFFQGKSNELIKLFSKASPLDKAKAKEILIRNDITNAGRYKDEIK